MGIVNKGLDWVLELGIRGLGFGIWDSGLELGIWIGDWDWELEFGTGIGNLGFGLGICISNWDGIDICDWDWG